MQSFVTRLHTLSKSRYIVTTCNNQGHDVETLEERKLKVIRQLETVAHGRYSKVVFGKRVRLNFISYMSIVEELPKPGKNQLRNGDIRDLAFSDSNQQDVAAGRPLLTSVAVKGKQELPGEEFFAAICARDNVTADTYEEKARIHKEEYLRAKEYPWHEVIREQPQPPSAGGRS